MTEHYCWGVCLPAGAPAKAVAKYASAAAAIGSMDRLLQFHYDAGSGHFRDWGLHSEEVELVWRQLPVQPGQQPQVRCCGRASVSMD